IADARVLDVMGRVPRHEFVLPSDRFRAYGDHPLPIGEGQTISQPYVVAFMTEAARIKPGNRVLEVGTGSGYQAAVLAGITDHVYTIEIREGLARGAADRLKALGYSRVGVRHGNGYHGWPENAPFDAILVTAAANHIPPPLIQQLRPGGRLVIPVGSTTYHQTLTLVTKGPDGKISVDHLLDVRFVPLIGAAPR
ncbi:MAG: protein-L-isoaspartate O-methyltransferase, partial [Nitrospirae bacterium RBG_16_64_22]